MDEQKQTATELEHQHPVYADGDAAPNGAGEEDDFHLMEELLADPAHAYRNLQYGDTVDGTIVRVERDSLLVDIGAKAEGVVPAKEMQTLAPEDREQLRAGDPLLVFVVQAEHRDGYAILSIDRARQERSWRRLQHAHDNNDVIAAQVANYNKGGLLVDLDGVRGFVPASQVSSIGRGSDVQKQSEMARLIGTEVTLKIIEINRERNRLILSERQAVQEVREEKKDELLSNLREGQVYEGTVSSICDFGVFVDIGGADGLVHLSELSWGRVRHPSEVISVGQRVKVHILNIDLDRRRIALSVKRTQNEPWSTAAERYQLNQIVDGVVTQITAFGAFARIEDGIEGLIHVSEMGEGHVQHPREMVSEGATIPVRIIRIDPARKRIGLSMHLRTETTPPDADRAEETPPPEPQA